jgi:hypothetical protein
MHLVHHIPAQVAVTPPSSHEGAVGNKNEARLRATRVVAAM